MRCLLYLPSTFTLTILVCTEYSAEYLQNSAVRAFILSIWVLA